MPIDWAGHVLANRHWGPALREYMRDYNHCTVLGSLCELLPYPDNRVTLAAEVDSAGMPIARFDYSQSDNDRANIAYASTVIEEIWEAAGGTRHPQDRPLRAPPRRLSDGLRAAEPRRG